MAASIIAAVATVVVALIEAYATVERRRSSEREVQREKLAVAQYDVSAAQSDGLRLLLRHAHGDNLNGDVERAISELDAAERRYTDVRTEIMAKVR